MLAGVQLMKTKSFFLRWHFQYMYDNVTKCPTVPELQLHLFVQCWQIC